MRQPAVALGQVEGNGNILATNCRGWGGTQADGVEQAGRRISYAKATCRPILRPSAMTGRSDAPRTLPLFSSLYVRYFSIYNSSLKSSNIR